MSVPAKVMYTVGKNQSSLMNSNTTQNTTLSLEHKVLVLRTTEQLFWFLLLSFYSQDYMQEVTAISHTSHY